LTGSSLRPGRHMFEQEGDAGARNIIKPYVHGIQACLGKLQLLDARGKITRDKVHIFREFDLKRDGREIGHDAAAIGVDEVDHQLMRSFIAGSEGDAQGDGALRMNGGMLRCRKLRRHDRVKGPQQAELLVLYCYRVAQNRHLNVHRRIKPRISRIGTPFFSGVPDPGRILRYLAAARLKNFADHKSIKTACAINILSHRVVFILPARA